MTETRAHYNITHAGERPGDLRARTNYAPPTSLAYGVDLSSHNPVADYDALAAYIDFAFLRSSYAKVTDNLFPIHLRELLQRDVLTGAYHYLYPADPTGQAELFAEQCYMAQQCGATLPPVVDVEQAGLTDAIVTEFTLKITEYAQRYNFQRPMIYTSYSRWDACTGNAPWGSAYPLWVAFWGSAPPLLPPVWDTWEFWQCGVADAGTVPGVPGRCDTNYYRADVDTLRDTYAPPGPPELPGCRPFKHTVTLLVTGRGGIESVEVAE